MINKNLSIHRVVVLKVKNVTSCGTGSCYGSGELLNKFYVKLIQKKIKSIDMMMTSKTRELEVYDFEMSDLSR